MSFVLSFLREIQDLVVLVMLLCARYALCSLCSSVLVMHLSSNFSHHSSLQGTKDNILNMHVSPVVCRPPKIREAYHISFTEDVDCK
jgi:hypothetical protein